MTVESDLRTFLLNDAAIYAITQDRIYSTGIKPQQSVEPAITFVPTDTDWAAYVDIGQATPAGINFTVDAWSPELAQARDLRNKIRARVQNFNGTMGSTRVIRIYLVSGPVDVYEDQLKTFRSTIIVVVHINE